MFVNGFHRAAEHAGKVLVRAALSRSVSAGGDAWIAGLSAWTKTGRKWQGLVFLGTCWAVTAVISPRCSHGQPARPTSCAEIRPTALWNLLYCTTVCWGWGAANPQTPNLVREPGEARLAVSKASDGVWVHILQLFRHFPESLCWPVCSCWCLHPHASQIPTDGMCVLTFCRECTTGWSLWNLALGTASQ